MKRLVLYMFLAFVLLAPALAMAAKGPALLSQGVEAYEFGEYQKATELLARSLSAGGLGPDQRAWVHCYLGAASYHLGRHKEAARQFGLAKAFAPDLKPPAWDMSPEVLEAFKRAPALGQGLRPAPRSPATAKAPPKSAPAVKPAPKPAPVAKPQPKAPSETARAGQGDKVDIAQAAALAGAEARRKAGLAKVEGVGHYNARRYRQAARCFAEYLKVFPDDEAVRNWRREALRLAGEMQVGSITVISEPRAQVLLDGKPKGLTPINLASVPAGERLVTVRAFGGSQQKRVRVRGRTAYELSFTLTGGALDVRSEPSAAIDLDGKEVGRTPLRLENLLLGVHRLRLRRQGYETQEHQVELRAGRSVKLEAVMQPR